MKLTESEQRILRAALREFDGTFQNDFDTLREHHTFLRDGDEEVDITALAQKVGVELAEEKR